MNFNYNKILIGFVALSLGVSCMEDPMPLMELDSAQQAVSELKTFSSGLNDKIGLVKQSLDKLDSQLQSLDPKEASDVAGKNAISSTFTSLKSKLEQCSSDVKAAEKQASTLDGNLSSVKSRMEKDASFDFSSELSQIIKDAGAAKGKLTATDSDLDAVGITVDSADAEIRSLAESIQRNLHVSSVQISQTSLLIKPGETQQLTATVQPSSAANQAVKWSSSNASVVSVDADGNVTALKAGTVTITVTSEDGGKTADCVVEVIAVDEYVDLGLSVKWATCNLGASRPEEYGGYYQWAGTRDVTSTNIYLDGNNCPYHIGTDYNTGWTKYIPSNKASYWSGSGSPDNKTVLDPDDDVAHVALGDKWHMPTYSEWEELIDNCTWTWTTVNGVNGYRVTSKKSGYTDKFIFLPAAGYRLSGDLYGVGRYGYYWSSSLNTGDPHSAYDVGFYSSSVGWYICSRYAGLSIRPVYATRVESVSLNKTALTLTEGASETLTATIKPDNASNKNVKWKSSDTGVATVDTDGKVTAVKDGSATITVTTEDGGRTASCTVTVTSEYVDLGLSVKWATCNLGASKPEEYGGYYQWAGTKAVTSTSIYLYWNNTPYHSGSSGSTGWTKYIPSGKSSYWSGSGSPDNKTVLDPEDDAAHVALGGKWRMPTDAEWTELYHDCTWNWTTVNGVNGYRVTSKKSGYTDKSIFLPAAGYRYNDSTDEVGSNGDYWSSSLNTDSPNCAWISSFDSSTKAYSVVYRFWGLPIRPVYGDEVHVESVSLNKNSLSLTEGQSETLTATVSPSTATNKSVTWESSNTGVATIQMFSLY